MNYRLNLIASYDYIVFKLCTFFTKTDIFLTAIKEPFGSTNILKIKHFIL